MRHYGCNKARMESIIVAACDLDKTLFPPSGPNHATQLRKNIQAMFDFENAGGFVFPVTGNNLLLAQKKFMDPEDGIRMLRELRAHPGIYMNGGLVLGPHGKEIEKHALGNLHLWEHPHGVDFITGLLHFWDECLKGPLLDDVGVLLLTSEHMAGYDIAFCNVDGYSKSQGVTAMKWNREEVIRNKSDISLILLLFSPIVSGKTPEEAREEYEMHIKPKQVAVQEAIHKYGLGNCSYVREHSRAGHGIHMTLMKDPWPEIDITVAGVDKGTALSRFLGDRDILSHLRQECIDPGTQLAVFGDAPNDVPMFKGVGDAQPGLRVRMPFADDTALIENSNMSGEVADVLQLVCEAKRGA